MFIEKHGQALKTAKETAVQNATNTTSISTARTKTNTASGIVNNLAYLNTSYNQSAVNVSQIESDYNNLADRLDCNANAYFDLSVNVTLPNTGILQIGTNISFQKSYGTKLILATGLSYRHTTYGGGNTFNLYYDIGAGWTLWDKFNYKVQNYVEFNQFYIKLLDVSTGAKTIRIGASDLSGDASKGAIHSVSLTAYEVS